MTEKSLNRRILMTQKLLKESLIEIMKRKPLNSITIVEVCERAGINRSTFYHHYSSTYDLYMDLIEDIKGEFALMVRRAAESDGEEARLLILFENIFQYAEDNRDLFLVLLSDKSSVKMGEEFCDFCGKLFEKMYSGEIAIYCGQFIAAGMSSVIWMWLRKENRRSAHDVALLTYRVVAHGIGQF